jgi:alkanesulfonate monooxygenase SsuD/methylene tetrahydromethanopterin reductase-like flavin-dependent oxidoreductase (luciferase family)
MASLQFGIFDTLSPAGANSAADVLANHIGSARLAEEVGYKYFFFIEHQNAGFPCVSAPGPYLGALALATRTIRIGAMVFQLPLHHPVRLAQDTAMVDQLSRGRLDFGIGYGTRLPEFSPWNVDYGARRAMGVEAMEIVLKAWSQPEFSHDGQFWSFKAARPQPLSYQQPHPPIWMGGHSNASFDYAAEHGFNLAQNLDVEQLIAKKFAYFRAAWAKKGRAGRPPRTMLVRHVHVAPTDRQARAEAEQFMLEGIVGQQGVARAMSLRPEEATPEMLEVARVYIATAKSYDFWIDEGLALVGSPETIIRRIREQQELTGVDVFLAHHHITSMPHQLALSSLKLFGKKIIPAFG